MAGETSIGTLLVRVLMDASGYDKEADKVGKETKNLGKLFKQTSEAIGGAFVVAAKAATAAVVGLAAASAVVGSSFEKAISKVAAVKGIDKSSEAFKRLSDEARRLGATTLFSASQAAEGMEELARAGLSTDEIISASQKALELAAGASISLADAASIVAASMAQFGLEAEEAGRITDVFTVASQNSLFSVSDMAQAMKFAGTTGSALGMTLEETSAAVAQFRDLGLEGTMAGTNFRGAMSALAKPTQEATAALKKYGLTADDVNPSMNSFRDIMLKFGKANLSAGDAQAIFTKRFGLNVKKIADGMAENSEGFDDLLSKLEEASGATGKTYEIMTDNVLGKFAELKSGAEELMIGLFETYAGPLSALLDAVINLVRLTAAEVGIASGEIGGSFEDAIGGFTQFINDNAAKWARQFAEIVTAAAAFAAIMTSMVIPALEFILPLVDDIAILMGTIWVAQKAAAFAALITGVVIPAITSMTFSLSGMATALTAATGGLTAVAAALVVVVTGLALLISRNREAARATEALRKEQELQAELADVRTRVLAGATEALLLSTQERLVAERALLDLSKEGDQVRAKEIDQILDLDAGTAALMVRRGELVKVGENLVTVESLVASGTAESAAEIDKVIARTEEAIKARQKAADAATSIEESERLTGVVDELRKKLIQLKRAKTGDVKVTQDQAVAADQAAAALGRQAARLNDATGATEEQEEATISLGRVYDDEAERLERINRLLLDRALAQGAATREAERAAQVAAEESRDGGTLKDAGKILDEAGRVGGAMVGGVIGAVSALLSAGDFLTGIQETLGGAEEFLANLPDVITGALEAITDALPGVVQALADALPKVITAIVDAIPGLIDAIVAALPVLIEGLIVALGTLLEALPELIIKVFDALPGIVATLAEAIPEIIRMLILALPDIISALVVGIVSNLPEIVATLIKLLLIDIPIMLVKLIPEFAKAIGKAILEMLKAIGEAIADFFKSIFNVFKKSDEKKEKREARQEKRQSVRESILGAYSGVSYIPRAMRVDVHQGEAIVPADRNAAQNGDTQSTAGFAAAHGGSSGGAGGGGSMDIAVMVEGRVLDAVQILSESRGHAPKVAREMRRAGGVKIGFNRGKFSPFTR